MKRFISLFYMSIVVISTFAQTIPTESSHMTFKGVPIDGTLTDFVFKLKTHGFDKIQTKDGAAILTGEFASFKRCLIGVHSLKQRDLVSQITVIFPEKEKWSNLSSDYFYLRDLLTEKYGKPAETIQKFDTYSEPDDDSSKLYAVQFDNCKYSTTYETEKGTIQLMIDHTGVSSCYVRLTYFDEINGNLIRKKAMEDL
ncbi:MAG: hypothetical protein BM564_03790 [Bacteroidetes bacterium MedPE-SWsnd-G2]|nr:MAG: hypothetical protein BM564_03790 [Bacteroidetes bacterium MedPE-SWsnd-G2]